MRMDEKTRNLEAWREGVSAGEGCLSLDALQELVRGGASDPKTAQHAAGCPHCQAELAMLRSFESSLGPGDDQAAVEWVAAQLQSGQELPSSPVRMPFWRGSLRVPQLAGTAAIVLLIGLGLSLYISTRQERPLLHGEPSGNQNMRSGDVRLISPSGNYEQVPEDFRWEAVPQAKNYTVQLFEVDGTVLWSGQSAESVLRASPDLKAKMRPGKALLWKVTALDASGKPIASSSTERFRITAEKPNGHL
jgi:hypothetical protein